MAKLGVQILKKLHWGKQLAFTQPKTQTGAIEFLDRLRMKTTQRSPPHLSQPIEGGGDDYDEDGDDDNEKAESSLKVVAQDPLPG